MLNGVRNLIGLNQKDERSNVMAGVWRELMKITDCLIKVIEFFDNTIDPPETWCKHPEYPWIMLSSKGYWKIDTKNEEFWKGVFEKWDKADGQKKGNHN